MKTDVLSPEERVFVGLEGELTQGVFVRMQTRVVCLAMLSRFEAELMCDTLKELVRDTLWTSGCCHPCCHSQAKVLEEETPVKQNTPSSFASDQSAETDSEADLEVGSDFPKTRAAVKTRFGLKDVEKMPDENVESDASESDTVPTVEPKAVFKGIQQTQDLKDLTPEQLADLQPEVVPSSLIEVGDGLFVPVHSKVLVSPKGLASSCDCLWPGCQHPSHGRRSESQRSENAPPENVCPHGSPYCKCQETGVVKTEADHVLSESPVADESRECGEVSGPCTCPPRAVPIAKTTADSPLEMCACGHPDSCPHPSHAPGYLDDD